MKKKKLENEKIQQPIVDIQTEVVNKERKNSYAIDIVSCILLAILLFFLRSKFWEIPYERDEGAYILFGKQFLEGKTPYLDFFDTRLPMLFYVYKFLASFGTTLKSTAVVISCINCITLWCIYFTAKKMSNTIVAVISAVSFIFITLAQSAYGFTRQSEFFVIVFELIGVAFLFATLNMESKKRLFYFLAGISLCLSMMVKHNGVFYILFGFIFIFIQNIEHKKIQFKNLVIELSMYGAGVLLVVGVLFLKIKSMGAYQEMIYWAFTHSKLYVSRVPFSDGMVRLSEEFGKLTANYSFFIYSSMAGVVLFWFTQKSFQLKFILSSFYILSFVTVMPSNQYYGHYFIMWMPAICIGVAMFFYFLYEKISIQNNLIAKVSVIGFFTIGVFMHFSKLSDYYLNPDYTEVLRTSYGLNPFPESVEIAKYINTKLKPNDKLTVVGSEQQLYLYTQTQPVSRHTIMYHLMVDTAVSKKPIEWQKEFIQDIEKANTDYLVFFKQGSSFLFTEKSSKQLFNWMDANLSANYDIVGVVDLLQNGVIYKWDADATNYKPQATDIVYVFKRKNLSSTDG